MRRYENNAGLLLALGCALLAAGCSDSSDTAPVKSLTVTTYNAGLALNFVPYTNERLPANEALLDGYDGDVICFQEVWLDDQVEHIRAAVSDTLPHFYTEPPEQIITGEAACTEEEIEGLANCALELCPGLSGNELVSCVPAQCGTFFSDLSPSCTDGVIASVGIPDITVDELVKTVTQPTGKFAFEGSLGLILASRYPLENREFQDFIEDSSANHRGALYADIQVGGQSMVVGCTHTAANLGDIIDYPASGRHGSWEGENRFMQQQLVNFAERKAAGRPVLVAGDFNCGTANPGNGVDPEWPANCQTWLDAGFSDPAGDQLPCTFCNDSNLVLKLGDGNGNTVIDHIYVKNLRPGATVLARRVFDDPISIEATVPPTELAPEDSPVMMHPSDHFGVELQVDWR
ncbi:MAG: endonuclease/exonuclease/phosphatase family protein [Halioglobus sp.]